MTAQQQIERIEELENDLEPKKKYFQKLYNISQHFNTKFMRKRFSFDYVLDQSWLEVQIIGRKIYLMQNPAVLQMTEIELDNYLEKYGYLALNKMNKK